MQIYLSLMSQKNPSSDSSSYDLSSPQGRMLYVRETTNAAFSSRTSPLQLGIEYVINSGEEDAAARVSEITGGMMAQQVMECSGSNAAIRSSLDLVSNAGRITLTGWPPRETSIPTDIITRKEIDIRGARTSAGEFEEAIELIYTKKVDVAKILTKTISLDEAPETIRDIEKNPGNYMKVVVKVDKTV